MSIGDSVFGPLPGGMSGPDSAPPSSSGNTSPTGGGAYGSSGGLGDQSTAQGGQGQSLRQTTTLSTAGSPIVLGQSPGPGTNCTVMLQTNFDTAYIGAVVDVLARTYGHEVIVESFTLSTAQVELSGADLQFTVGGVAADFWVAQITLQGPDLPAANLESSIAAFGVENGLESGGNVPPASLTFSSTGLAPGATGLFEFEPPPGTDTYLLTAIAVVQKSGGGGEAVGDSYSVVVPTTWKNLSGVVYTVAPTLAAPDVSTDTSMATMSFGPSGTTGAAATIPFTVPSSLDAGTLVDVLVTLLPLNVGAL